MAGIDVEMAVIAARQHSLIALEQLIGLGGSRQLAHRRVKAGLWRRVESGVYFVCGHPFTWEARVLAQVLAAGEGALASHRAGAVLWGVEGFRRGRPEISVHRHRRPLGLDARVHEPRSSAPRSGRPFGILALLRHAQRDEATQFRIGRA